MALVADNLREHAAILHTAVTRADWGIAATGTLGIISNEGNACLASLNQLTRPELWASLGAANCCFTGYPPQAERYPQRPAQ